MLSYKIMVGYSVLIRGHTRSKDALIRHFYTCACEATSNGCRLIHTTKIVDQKKTHAFLWLLEVAIFT